MTGPAAPYGTASTRPPPSANGSAPPHPVPQPPGRGQTQTPPSGMRTKLIAGSAVLVVAVIFIIQNAHSANISFLGVHLVLPLGSPSSGRSSGAPCARPGPAKQPATNPPCRRTRSRQMTHEKRVSRP
jgi:hypothetical protein